MEIYGHGSLKFKMMFRVSMKEPTTFERLFLILGLQPLLFVSLNYLPRLLCSLLSNAEGSARRSQEIFDKATDAAASIESQLNQTDYMGSMFIVTPRRPNFGRW